MNEGNPGELSDESRSEEVDLFREPGFDDEKTDPGSPTPRPPRVLSVGGAKGGVGKSMLAANLALYLASIGRRVVLVDADVEGANLHTVVGVRRPKSVFDSEREEMVPPSRPERIETAIPGLVLHHAGLDEPAAGKRRRARRARLSELVRSMNADYVVVDAGSGTASSLLDFHLASDLWVFLTLPEPTALESTYRFLRHAFVRHLRRVVDPKARHGLLVKIDEMGGTPSPLDLWRRLEDDGDPLADHVREEMEAFRPRVVLNQARLRADLELGEAMRSAARRRLGITIDYLGYIDYDDTVWNCVRNRRLLLVESPGAKSSKSIEKIARRLVAIDAGKSGRDELRTVPPESHHDLLEVDRGATDEEVRRAYKRAREIYASDALCCYGLFEPHEIDHLRRRLEEAYDVLLDPARRRPYERSVFPVEPEYEEIEPVQVERRGALPPAPDLAPDADYTGALLKAVRESQGLTLRDISQRTKVGLAYLHALEEESFGSLPAPVYVGGFVTELAKCLRLDAAQVSRTYVRRYRRFLEERSGRA